MAQINTTQNFDEIVQQVAKAIQALRFGSVEVTVHEGRITQIETRDRKSVV